MGLFKADYKRLFLFDKIIFIIKVRLLQAASQQEAQAVNIHQVHLIQELYIILFNSNDSTSSFKRFKKGK